MAPDIRTINYATSKLTNGSAATRQSTIIQKNRSIDRGKFLMPDKTILIKSSSSLASSSSTSSLTCASAIMRQNLLTVEKLRERVSHILKCVINLHIDILVLESNVNQLLDDVKEFNADLMEVKRLDNLIQTLRDYNGPTICHEWPFPLAYQQLLRIDEADLAQTLNNTTEIMKS